MPALAAAMHVSHGQSSLYGYYIVGHYRLHTKSIDRRQREVKLTSCATASCIGEDRRKEEGLAGRKSISHCCWYAGGACETIAGRHGAG